MKKVLNFSLFDIGNSVFPVFVLSILEISLSFDNAVVNATVLKDMDPVWQAIDQVREDTDNAFDYRKHLVGHIRQEYRLADTVKKSINALMAPLIEQYSRFHN